MISDQVVNGNFSHPESGEEFCQKHPGEKINKYCSVCCELICKICVLGLHRRHRANDIENIADDKRRELTNLHSDILNSHIPNLKSMITMVHQVTNENNIESKKTEEAIRQRSEQLKDAIDQITNKCIEEAKTVRENRETVLEKTVVTLDKTLQELTFCGKSCQEALSTNNCIHMVRTSQKIKMRTEKIGTSATVPSLMPLQFSPGKLSSKTIDASFGHVSGRVHSTLFDHFEMTSSMKISNSAINLINSRTDRVWINYENSNNLNLININGQIDRTIELKVTIEGLEVLPNGNLIMSIPEKKCVVERNTDGTMTEMINMGPLKPWGICLTQSGDILVCLFEELGFSAKSSRRRLVQRYSFAGEVLATMEFEDEMNLFNLPYRVRESSKGDIAVVDVMSKESARIVTLQNTGRVKFIYDGVRSVNKHAKFNPYDICFDSISNLLVADKNSKAVHLLNSSGYCLMVCASFSNCFATALGSSAEGSIWVGYSNGKIEVLRPKYHALIYHHDD